jgi:adhesin transport system outer membrane protein
VGQPKYQQKEQLRYAKSSEENIKKQTGMEEARVKQGSGFSTDVLQSKSKLASAYARTARADGEFIKALNDFRSLYQFAPKDLESFIPPGIPRQYIPKKLEDALSIASEFNTDIVKSKFDVEIAQTDITAARSKHFPTITLKGNVKHKRNDQGIIGIKEEYRAGVEFNLPLFSGGKDQAGLSRSYADLNAMKDQRLHVRREVDKKVRNAWQDFQTDQINAGFLRNSANISEQFLVLARQERKLGRRSLIDVLSEENSYINALQAAIKAETSVLLSAYALLKEMGILNAKMVY